jgi:hypothetical protein
MVRLINENQQATMEYYIQVKKIYFYAAVALLEGTNRLGGSLLDLASIGTASRAASATGVQTLSVSVSDAPFVFLNALYIIKRSTDCGANKASDPTSINALVLISFATSAALLGSDFAVALCDLMLEAVPKLSCMQVQGHAADKTEGISRPRNSSQSSTEGARGHAASGAFNR